MYRSLLKRIECLCTHTTIPSIHTAIPKRSVHFPFPDRVTPGIYPVPVVSILGCLRFTYFCWIGLGWKRRGLRMTFGNRKRRNPWFVWTPNNLGLWFHALVAVHHTVVGGHHASVDSRSLVSPHVGGQRTVPCRLCDQRRGKC